MRDARPSSSAPKIRAMRSIVFAEGKKHESGANDQAIASLRNARNPWLINMPCTSVGSPYMASDFPDASVESDAMYRVPTTRDYFQVKRHIV